MPELPEIASRAAELNANLPGKLIQQIEIFQPKSLNLPAEDFKRGLEGATIQKITYRGKWIYLETSQGWLLLNMGMGGEILLKSPDTLPEKRRLVLHFTDGTSLSINFWWFGYAHYVPAGQLDSHEMTARLGPDALDITPDELARIMNHQKNRLKTFLLDQSKIAGIGNAYIHDILFLARLHPLRPLNSLTHEEVSALAEAIQQGLRPSLEKGGAFYEMNLFGEKGRFTMDDILVGYKEGLPCPVCSTPIEKIKTGATSSYICPCCQAG